MAKVAVLWFRNDLRLRDNQLLHYPEARAASSLLALYCIDPRHFEWSRWGDHPRTGLHRARFLAESLIELDRSLKAVGSKLLLVAGQPEDVIPGIVGQDGLLAYQQEDTYEEQRVEARVLQRLPSQVIVLHHQQHSLLNREDLGWDPKTSLPMPFGKYWHGECQTVQPRAELPAIKLGDLPAPPECIGVHGIRIEMKELARVMGFNAEQAVAKEAEFVWHGGEEAAQAQMSAYATSDGLGTHMQTRNRFHGLKSFSRLSPWLANGCLSPRTVYWWASEYFQRADKKGSDPRFDHFHKYVFQLCWRDFFRFYCAHFGPKVFFLEGPALKKRPWKRDADTEQRWKEGQTGVPIVDALMRELSATGYMSNRGRYTVASYLVFYLEIDWRVGADWFEHCLLDHDVCSNYGEWASMANVAVDLGQRYPMGLKGRGPSDSRDKGRRGGGGDPWAKGAQTGDAVFDPWEQAAQYDRSEEFVRRWVPEVAHLPKGQAHDPPDLSPAYPRPLAVLPSAMPKSSASGGPDGPYGPYYDDRCCSYKRAEKVPEIMGEQKEEHPVNAQRPQVKERWKQSLYDGTPIRAEPGEHRNAKPVRRWMPKTPTAVCA